MTSSLRQKVQPGKFQKKLKTKKILITGSRDASPQMIKKAEKIASWCMKKSYYIICGDASGIDTAVIRTASSKKYKFITVCGAKGYQKVMTPYGENWFTIGSYPERDAIMAFWCDMCFAIWNGRSNGTRITFTDSKNYGRPTVVFDYRKKKVITYRAVEGRLVTSEAS